MHRLMYIKNWHYGHYLVAGDRWDGAVYHQMDKDRPNAVWARIPVDAANRIYRFLDLRHGHHLANGSGFVVQGQYLQVVNVPVYELKLDKRAQWKQVENDQTRRGTLTDEYEEKHLYIEGSDVHVRLTSESKNEPYQEWKFEDFEGAGHFDIPRLVLPENNTINYQIDLSSRPDYFRSRVEFSDQGILNVFADAVGKWTKAFSKMGLDVSAQRADQPQIMFRWGDVKNPDVGGHTPQGGSSGALNDRSDLSLPLKVTLRTDLEWGGGWLEHIGFTNPAVVQYDLRAAIAHEMGHVLGLEHCDDAQSVMIPKLEVGPVWPRIGESICPYDCLRLRARYVDRFYPSPPAGT